MTLPRLLVILLALVASAPGALAQELACAAPPCAETEAEAETVAVLTGSFRAAANVTATEIDLLAALEQQRWREFRFLADAPARVVATLQTDPAIRPDDWPQDAEFPGARPTLTRLYSLDGNAYAAFDAGDVLPEDATLALIVRQATTQAGDGALTFYPATWTLTVTARPAGETGTTVSLTQLPGDALPEFDPLTDEEMIELLDCAGGDCPDGDAQPPASDPPTPPPASPGNDDLASALQAELARVGCYAAAVDGLWGPASRRAMAAFNEASGATADTAAPSAQALVAVARATGAVCAAD